jgi:hypothetical protein
LQYNKGVNKFLFVASLEEKIYMAEIIKFIYLMILFISLLVVLTDIVASITIYPCKPFFISF